MITHLVEMAGHNAEMFTREGAREFVYGMEGCIKSAPQVEIKVEHYFAEGLYMRKIFIPAGLAWTGRVHKQDDLQIIFYGELAILTEDGFKRFTGPDQFTSKKGVKPFAVSYQDTLWATVHHTHLTDLDEIEKELFEDEESLVDFASGQVKQEALPCQA